MSSSAPFISVVIPAYNEAKTITESVRRIQAFETACGADWEVVVVNDGSTDDTEKVLLDLQNADPGHVRILSEKRNRGKGFATKKGILSARGKYVLLTDADLSCPIKESTKLIRSLQEGADVAVGSRAVHAPDTEVQQTLKRRVAGRIFNLFVSLLAFRGIRDTQCGFKAFSREAAQEIFSRQTFDGFSFDVEVLYLAKKKGYRIQEVSVMWRQGPHSHVRLVPDSIRMLRDLLKIRKIHGTIPKR